MSAYYATRIEKQEFFKLAPLKRGRGNRRVCVIGFDTEADTTDGTPMLLQLSRNGDEHDVDMFRVQSSRETLNTFCIYIARHCTRKDTEYVFYGWNLAYEFTQLFSWLPAETRNAGSFLLEARAKDWDDGRIYAFKLDVKNDKRQMLAITNLATKRQIRVLDGMSFFKTSLDNAAKMLGVGEKYKDNAVRRELFTRADLDDARFLKYAATDAYITRLVGEHIVKMHEQYDVTTCISAPHFASKVFKRRYLTGEIQQPSHALEQAGLYSYHGGKNGFYLTEPTHLPHAYQYDITSAYPEAMRSLPDVVESEWRDVRDYQPGRHAIYMATLNYRQCKYRGMMDYDGSWPNSGYYEQVYLTSYELDAMVERGECDVIRLRGWEMVGPPGGPLTHYVDEFFKLKATTTGPERETAKLFLNSLYGKFFQKVPHPDSSIGSLDWNIDSGDWRWIESDPNAAFDWRAGGLYHPPIASLITGFVRAKIHRLEHKYESLMTSTDGIFGLRPPDETDLGKHLGGLTWKRGDLKIWRERLYIFRPDDGSEIKAAYHGFRGKLDTLDALPLVRGSYEYVGRQMVTLKMSTRGLNGQRYEPGQFVDVRYQIVI